MPLQPQPQGPSAGTVDQWVEAQGRQLGAAAARGRKHRSCAGQLRGECCLQPARKFTAQSPDQVTAGHFRDDLR